MGVAVIALTGSTILRRFAAGLLARAAVRRGYRILERRIQHARRFVSGACLAGSRSLFDRRLYQSSVGLRPRRYWRDNGNRQAIKSAVTIDRAIIGDSA